MAKVKLNNKFRDVIVVGSLLLMLSINIVLLNILLRIDLFLGIVYIPFVYLFGVYCPLKFWDCHKKWFIEDYGISFEDGIDCRKEGENNV